MTSPFLSIPPSEWIASNDLAFAIFDRYPVSPGHALVIPRRECATWFDATPAERAALLALVDIVKQRLDREQRDPAHPPPPDGYNIGWNVGEAAGQTVMHLHIHVIPRWRGDMDDPRGGVRHVIPARGNYLRTASPPTDPLAPSLSRGEPPRPDWHMDVLDDRLADLASSPGAERSWEEVEADLLKPLSGE